MKYIKCEYVAAGSVLLTALYMMGLLFSILFLPYPAKGEDVLQPWFDNIHRETERRSNIALESAFIENLQADTTQKQIINQRLIAEPRIREERIPRREDPYGEDFSGGEDIELLD